MSESQKVIEVPVELGDASYVVRVGAGVRLELGECLRECLPEGVRRVAVVMQANIGWGEDLGWGSSGEAEGESRAQKEPAGGFIEKKMFVIPDGEEAKTMSVIERLCRDFAEWGLTRGDVVVGVGGGVVTDVAGFAAAVYHRGLPVIHVPTTLLGQVDAAIGGKTGVNLPEGKNLVGAFWQPSAVLCDTETLSTLPEREFRSGCGEIAKYELLGAERLNDMALEERIARCVALKAEIVASDERESGRRALLNYGHTLAHALEIAGGFELTHGEAVGIGLIYAAEVAHLMGRIDDERVAEDRQVVSSYGLATSLSEAFASTSAIPPPETLIALFARDKKAIGDLTFVLDGPNGPEVVKGVPNSVLQNALERVL